jgi:hypothetical protein
MSHKQSNTTDGDGAILTAEELDISNDENVRQIDENRFVVSPGDGPPQPRRGDRFEDHFETPDVQPAGQGDAVDSATVKRLLRQDLQGRNTKYGFQITATFDGRVAQHELTSNDITTVFENLLLWYAQHLDGDTPVEEVLAILLLKSNVPLRYPTKSLQRLVARHDLSADDSIGDLLEAVDGEGVVFRSP